MAKKAKGFRALYRQATSKAVQQQASLKKLEKSVTSKFDAVVTGPQDEKMSDILEAFVEPYEDPDMSLEDRRTLLRLAAIAWNFALIPDPDKRKALKENFFENGIDVTIPAIPAEIEELIEALIARKETYFANNQRYIVNFELEDLGDECYLSVASTLQP
ncbi:MAG: hypothetical protein AAFV85_14640 [Cyanobacteria bacterium J06634_6]